jgi:hypothetical protein
MLAPAVAVLLRSQGPWRLAISALILVVIHRGLDDWSGMADRTGAVYWPTVGAFLLLCWTGVLAVVGERWLAWIPVWGRAERGMVEVTGSRAEGEMGVAS